MTSDPPRPQGDALSAVKDENYQLKLLICGGEDAPGYAASLTLSDMEEVVNEHQQLAFGLRDELDALAERLNSAEGALRTIDKQYENINLGHRHFRVAAKLAASAHLLKYEGGE